MKNRLFTAISESSAALDEEVLSKLPDPDDAPEVEKLAKMFRDAYREKYAGEFKEELHPRDEGGQFTSGSGMSGGGGEDTLFGGASEEKPKEKTSEPFDPVLAPRPALSRLPGATRDLVGVSELEDGRYVGATQMSVQQLNIDPVRFQYKIDKINPETGATKSLENVKKFRPEFAGQLLVWHDPEDGSDYVVNGHHRYGLAKRLGFEGNLSVFFVDAKTADEARAVGALANMSEGRGTSVDAAKFMRDMSKIRGKPFGSSDLEAESISLTEKVAEHGMILSTMADAIFQKVSNGQMKARKAVAIGRHLENHDMQVKFLEDILKKEEKTGKNIPDRVIMEAAMERANAPSRETKQKTLFGEETSTESLWHERAQLKNGVRRAFAKEKASFAAASEKAHKKLLETKGENVVDVAANKQAAEVATAVYEHFESNSRFRGPMSDIMNKYSEKLKDEPKKQKTISSALIEELRQYIHGLVLPKTAPDWQRSGEGVVAAHSRVAGNGSARKSRQGLTDRFSREFQKRGWTSRQSQSSSLVDRFSLAFAGRGLGRYAAEFKEDEHPRDADGQFSSKDDQARKPAKGQTSFEFEDDKPKPKPKKKKKKSSRKPAYMVPGAKFLTQSKNSAIDHAAEELKKAEKEAEALPDFHDAHEYRGMTFGQRTKKRRYKDGLGYVWADAKSAVSFYEHVTKQGDLSFEPGTTRPSEVGNWMWGLKEKHENSIRSFCSRAWAKAKKGWVKGGDKTYVNVKHDFLEAISHVPTERLVEHATWRLLSQSAAGVVQDALYGRRVLKQVKSLYEADNEYGEDVRFQYKSNQKKAQESVEQFRDKFLKSVKDSKHPEHAVPTYLGRQQEALSKIKSMLSDHSADRVDVDIRKGSYIHPDTKKWGFVEWFPDTSSEYHDANYHIEKANKALSGLVSKDVVESLQPVNIQLSDKKKYRASYSEMTSSINLGRHEVRTWDVGTIAHEMGHALEYHGKLRDAAIGFLMSRTDADGYDYITRIADTNHDLNEVGNPDDFEKLYKVLEANPDKSLAQTRRGRAAASSAAYNGKVYLDRTDGGFEIRSTEVFSMGLENLIEHPVSFAQHDPEYFNFMIASLMGYHSKK